MAICDCCGAEVPEEDLFEGMCPDCVENSSGSCVDWCGNPTYPACIESCSLHDD